MGRLDMFLYTKTGPPFVLTKVAEVRFYIVVKPNQTVCPHSQRLLNFFSNDLLVPQLRPLTEVLPLLWGID